MNAAPALNIAVREKRFANGLLALAGLSVQVAAGEFVAVVGPSGAGKSTLLNLIAGLDTAYEGDISGVPHAHLGFMFQEPRLMPWLSACDNLQLVAPQAERDELESLLAAVELGAFAHAYPNQLSGGMARRLALARAFAVAPQLLLMDEPFTGLDAPTAARLRRLLQDLCAHATPTVVLVTHQLNEALALADRVVFLSGSPARVVLEHRPTRILGAVEDLRLMQPQADALLSRYPHLLHGEA